MSRTEFEIQVAEVLDELFVKRTRGHFGRGLLREFFAPRVAAAICAASGWPNDEPAMQRGLEALAALAGHVEGHP